MTNAGMSASLLCATDKPWKFPAWTSDLGTRTSYSVRRLVSHCAPLIRRAQADGIEHVAPILVALRCDPAEAKRKAGKGIWKRVHASSLAVNAQRARILIHTRIPLADVMRFPPGALREVVPKCRNHREIAVICAGVIARNRTEFREAVMLAEDTIRMCGEINRAWSLRRLREEHDRLALQYALRTADPTPWCEPWAVEIDGYRFTLMNSAVEFSAEALIQRHCVASYARDARQGRCHVFRIEGAERATVRIGGYPPRVQEVRARFNAPVSESCRRACAKMVGLYRTCRLMMEEED